MEGEPGITGLPGIIGRQGLTGETGDIGLFGYIGQPGIRGERGDYGAPGFVGLPGIQGEKGYPGLPGFTGEPGEFGKPGLPGDKGSPGLVGDYGSDGLPGFPGSIGIRGDSGLPGLPGLKGRRGQPGLPGRPAAPGPGPKSRGFFFTRHSQSERVPICPKNSIPMWSGYSLLHVMGNAKAHGQDLGAPGSCLKRFNTMPYLFCNLNDVCDYAQRNDYSYWLSTTEPMPAMMTPIPALEVARYISR